MEISLRLHQAVNKMKCTWFATNPQSDLVTTNSGTIYIYIYIYVGRP